MSTTEDRAKYSVPALDRSILIIEYLSELAEGVSLSDVCRDLNLPKTSVYNILNTLETHGFIRKDHHGLYWLGLKLYSLGMKSIRNIDVQMNIIPYMEKLRDETGFTVHLAAYDRGEAIALEKIEGQGMIQFQAYVGERKKMNTSGGGKAIAAYLPENELQTMFSKGLNCATPNSITSEHELREHLKKVRQVGYAIDDEEGEMGVRCIGIPIFLSDGIVYGSVSITTLKSNLPAHSLAEYGEKMLYVGREISRRLGYTGPYPKQMPDSE